jgi:hypothetical protein
MQKENQAANLSEPGKDLKSKLLYVLKYHLHILLYTYFWFGLFLCGLFAPDERILELGSNVIKKGWHLSAFSACLILPVPALYLWLFRNGAHQRKGNGQ